VAREDSGTGAEVTWKKERWFFAGEATLGLVRLSTIDPEGPWLEAARRAADYLVNVRDGGKDERHLPHDQWLSYALHDLYTVRPDPGYAEHARKIARAILLFERRGDAPYPDFRGSFYDEGDSTLASARLESLVSTLELERYVGGDEQWLMAPAIEVAGFVRSQQLDDDSAYFARSPGQARGGVRESFGSNHIRIDYVQHAISGWLRLARLRRDPSYGTHPH
jgi:hypothetical protein